MKPNQNRNPRNRPSERRILASLITIWLLIGTACSLPGIRQPDVPASPTSTVKPPSSATLPPVVSTRQPSTPKSTAAPLPPALVESSPPPNSELGPRQPVILYFNQGMEKASVEAALQAVPAVAGSFKWLSDDAVTFTPDQALPADSAVKFSLSTTARSASGLQLADPVELNFRTSTGLIETDLLPKPGTMDADPLSAVVATFNRPVVALGADPASLLPAFTLDPPARGRGEWLNTSTYIFYPDPALAGGTRYTVVFKPGLSATDGSGWAKDHQQSWTFTTVVPGLVSVSPDGKARVALDEPFILTFNQPMDRASLEQNMSFSSSAGPAAGTFAWNEDATRVTFTPRELLGRGMVYTLRLPAHIQSASGAKLKQEYSQRYTTYSSLSLDAEQPRSNGVMNLRDVMGTLNITATAPLAEQDLKPLINFTPAVEELSVFTTRTPEIYISGLFQASTHYTLRISSALKDKWGAAMDKDFILSFDTSAFESALSIASDQPYYQPLIFLTPSETSLSGYATNIKTARISLGSLTLEEYARLEAASIYFRARTPPSDLIEWEVKLNSPADQSTKVDLPLTKTGGSLAPGLYFYRIDSPEIDPKNASPFPAILTSSRIHLELKASSTQVLVWAVDLVDHRPFVGAEVQFYTADGDGKLAPLGSAVTDADGLAQLDSSASLGMHPKVYAVMGKPGDGNFAMVSSFSSFWLDGSSFGFPTDYSASQLHLYFYTDRPIYRPGQTVYFRAALYKNQNGRYLPAGLDQVHLKAMGVLSRGERQELVNLTLPLSPYGTFNGSFQLPEDAAPGYYSIEIKEMENEVFNFQVAEYRKPEVDLSVTPQKDEIKRGEDLSAQIKTRYYFGAPAANLKVQWTLTSRPDLFQPLVGYQTGDWDISWLMPLRYAYYEDAYNLFGGFITSGEGTTAQDGTLDISIPAKVMSLGAEQVNLQKLILEVTVTDENEYQVSNRAEISVHPAEIYIGVKSEAWSGQAGQAMGFSIQTVDWTGTEKGNRNLQAVFQKVTWVEKRNWQPGFGSLYEEQFTPVASTEFATDARGKARLEYTPPQAGTYQLEVKGDGAVSRVIVWVGGAGRTPWPKIPDQHLPLQLDAAEYSAGQTAQIFIPNPLGEKTLALITVERGKVMWTDVIPVSANDFTYSLPVTVDFAPNVYISVTLLGKPGGVPDYRYGLATLKVRPDAFRLQVEVDLPTVTVQPGSQTFLKITVRDDKGFPVQGEFSAALVDKALLALRDPIEKPMIDDLYGVQPLSVNSSLQLSNFSRNISRQFSAPGRGGAGGGGLDTVPQIRTQFEDTAYWNGSFETDSAGQAQLSVKLPDNLTTWVILVRGVDKQRRVGEAKRELVVSKDLMVRPVTPRFLVAGDRVELAAMVHNNTAASLEVNVSLLASGVEQLDAAKTTQKVTLPAQDRVRVTWWVRVLEGEKADLRFSVSGGGLQDAATPAWGELPILSYIVPQTFTTAGVLAEAGERLEVVSLPRSYSPTAGGLSVELSPSLAAAILNGLKAVEVYPSEYVEDVLSRMVPNLRTYTVLKRLGINSPELEGKLKTELAEALQQVLDSQRYDGGWGWAAGETSHPYLTAYALLALSEAKSAGMEVGEVVTGMAQAYLMESLKKNQKTTKVGELEQAVFLYYALAASGKPQAGAVNLYEQREKLAPWARALLAMSIEMYKPGDEKVKNLVSLLQSGAQRTASGAYWDSGGIDESRITTPNFSTAMVVLALARLDPAAAVLTDAVRYLVAHRQACGCWTSAYEAAWVLSALAEVLQVSGEQASSFEFSASLNGTTVAAGKAGGAQQLSAVQATVPLGNLSADQPNALLIQHGAGSGRLYYRANLQISQPVELAQPIQAGVSLTRRYYLGVQDCRKQTCSPIDTVQLSGGQVVLVRLTVTVPKAMYSLVLEDHIPAGMEIVDTSLNTTRRTDPSGKEPQTILNNANPFSSGWNWWTFGTPQIRDQRIEWMARYIPAGTYEITYRLTPLQVGEYRAIPARVYQKYFPEVQGTCGGAVFTVQP